MTRAGAQLHPQAAELLAAAARSGRPNAHLLPVREARRHFEADAGVGGPGEPVLATRDLQIPVDGGTARARVYRPAGGRLPVVVYFHGGGWVLGSIESHDATCRALANASGAVLVSVGYRRAPEHRFPTAVDDAHAALRWVAERASELDVDAQRLAVAGDSAGGNLAAAGALLARERGGPRVAFQLLVYPVTTTDLEKGFDPAYEGMVLERDEIRWQLDSYVPSPEDRDSPLVSPLDSAHLEGLPPALVITAGCDPLHAQGELYARALARAGVPVEHAGYPRMAHGFFQFPGLLDDARAAILRAGAALRSALAKDARPSGTRAPSPRAEELDAVVVGAGFSGLYMLHRLRGLGLSVRVLERGNGVGGTWFWNRYPGARCDIDSLDYSYSFSPELEQDWQWTERYATQPEILRYLNHVADRFDLRRDIQLGTLVTHAHYDEGSDRWAITTEDGGRLSARYCIMAVGNLSSVKRPPHRGLECFAGEWYHTAEWPQGGVDFRGRRVGVIGTGSTGIQVIPQIAAQAERVHVFQRTPNYSMPAHNAPLDPQFVREVKLNYAERRRRCRESEAGVPTPAPEKATFEATPDERETLYEAGWQRGGINALSAAFTDFFTDHRANQTAAEFARDKIRAAVSDPAVAEVLCPAHHIGTKRTCVDIGYYETYNRDHVELVDISDAPIEAITPSGVRTRDGEYELEQLVFAIGFDAMTGALFDIDIRGADGRTLRASWAHGPRTYLGLATAGLPNLFMVTGPGSPSVLSNMVVSIEQHVDWIADCIAYLTEHGVQRIEATVEAEDAWVAHVNALADATLYPLASSWYLGANIPGKPRVFMPYVGGVAGYRRECDAVAARGYEGFALGARGRSMAWPRA